MKQTKSIIPSFAFYDRTGIQKYLENQARQGWMLESTGNYRWKFCRTEPREMHFAVVYFPQADLYDPAPGDAELTFREFCVHGGWTPAGSNGQMQIFYSHRENPTPIETDPVLEVENIHRAMKKSALPAYWLLELSCVLQLASQWMSLQNGLVRYLSNGVNLYFAAVWCVLSVIALSRHLCYVLWRRKAKTAAERDNIFLETKSTIRAENLASALILLTFLVMILTLPDRTQAVTLAAAMVLTFGVIAVTELLRKKMKKDGYDAAVSKRRTMITSVALTLTVALVLVPGIARSVMEKWPEETETGAVLNIRELLGDEADDYETLLLTDQESVFLRFQNVYQYPEGTQRTPKLEYDLLEVKAPFLYRCCLEEMMTVPEYMENGVFQSVDPAPWGAEKVWQLQDGEEMRDWYVVGYENIILEIIPDWELTDAQKAQIGRLLG